MENIGKGIKKAILETGNSILAADRNTRLGWQCVQHRHLLNKTDLVGPGLILGRRSRVCRCLVRCRDRLELLFNGDLAWNLTWNSPPAMDATGIVSLATPAISSTTIAGKEATSMVESPYEMLAGIPSRPGMAGATAAWTCTIFTGDTTILCADSERSAALPWRSTTT